MAEGRECESREELGGALARALECLNLLSLLQNKGFIVWEGLIAQFTIKPTVHFDANEPSASPPCILNTQTPDLDAISPPPVHNKFDPRPHYRPIP